MLIRFSVKNLFSFDDEVEFNMLPGRINRLSHHKYKVGETEILKMAALYGANGAGKSNLIKAISAIKRLTANGRIFPELITQKFKLAKESIEKPVYLGIEFVKNGIPFLYDVQIQDAVICEERLYLSGLGRKDDKLLFCRKTINKVSQIEFFPEFYKTEENKALGNVIEKTLIKPNYSALHLIGSLENKDLLNCKLAFSWITDDLEIISPNTKPLALAHMLDLKPNFKNFANDLICSFSTGVSSLEIEKLPIERYAAIEKKDVEEISAKLLADPKRIAILNDDIIVVNEEGGIFTKQLQLYHKCSKGAPVVFNIGEESDGTIRLLEYIPAIQEIIEKKKVYIIDEIERSIHALVIKEIISKFSFDSKTKGQLIFSTHESSLLDQEIFRQDEIWFVQKNNEGATEIYPLSDFKEHHTLDIRKGYLNGRYGGIPFLSNLHDLNWDKYAVAE